MLPDRLADRRDHLGVGADQIVAAHAGLARDAGGDDHDIGAGDLGIVVGAADHRVVALDRRAFDDVERLPLRHPLDDVEQHDVAQFLEPGEQRDRAADLAGADQRDLVACHGKCLVLRRRVAARDGPPLTANRRSGQGDGRRRNQLSTRPPFCLENISPAAAGRRTAWPTRTRAPHLRPPRHRLDRRRPDRRPRSFRPAMRRRAPRKNRPGRSVPPGSPGLSLAALGVVFGDIGTSPVYTFRECFNPEHGLALAPENVLGVLSLIVWALILVVAVKYVLLDHACRQSGRGRDPGLAGAGAGGDQNPARPDHPRPAGDRRRRAVLRRQHDHPGDLGAERDRRDRRRHAQVEQLRAAADGRGAGGAVSGAKARHRECRTPVRPGHARLVRGDRGRRADPDRPMRRASWPR